MGTYRHWKGGQDDPTEVARAYSGHFFDVCRDIGARGYVLTTRGDRQRIEDGLFTIENCPVPGMKSGGFRYHLGQIAYGIGLLKTAIRQRADYAIVSNGTHWFVLSFMALSGVKVVPALHCTLWPMGRPPVRRSDRIIAALNGLFWRRFAWATLCISPECARQATAIAGKPRGPMIVVAPQYRRQYLDALQPAQWPREGAFRVLYAGRIERNKGVFDLLEVAKRLHERRPGRFAWDICGGGSDLDALRQAVKDAELEENFRLRGTLNSSAMAEAFGQAHAVIAPTTPQFPEGLNKVCVEAVLSGRPLVTSVHCPAAEVLGAAAIAVPCEVEAFAEALLKLADDPAAYAAMIAAQPAVRVQFYDPSRSWAAGLRTVLGR